MRGFSHYYLRLFLLPTNSKKNPFVGLMKSSLIVDCSKCGRVLSPCFQKFSTVSLSIPLKHQNHSLQDSLGDFTVEERVSGVECPKCYSIRKRKEEEDKEQQEEVPIKYTARKRLTFTRPPKVLCLHLRRLVRGSRGEPVKSSCHVGFPLDLDLAPFCSFGCNIETAAPKKTSFVPKSVVVEKGVDDMLIDQLCNRKPFSRPVMSIHSPALGLGGGSNYSQAEADLQLTKKQEQKQVQEIKQPSSGSQMYRLVSVIVHLGSHLGGHYAVYRKLLTKPVKELQDYEKTLLPQLGNERNSLEDWVYISDEKVQPCSVSEVLESQAYMLYYEKY